MEIFGADLRSLAALRIVLAATVLADLTFRSKSLVAHYTDLGVLPRWTLIQTELYPWQFTLNLLSGEPLFQAFLFGVTALAALGMLVGYRTRLMTIVVWVMVLSIQWRNPLVLSGADNLLRVLLFWAMFLPLGYLLGLVQSWEMFAPSPSAWSTTWYVIPGTLRDGREVDLFASAVSGDPSLVKEVSWEKPPNIAGTMDKYWRKYLENLNDGSEYHNRILFADYICREWNTLHKGGAELTTVRVAHMTERTLSDYRRATPEREWLLKYTCQVPS
jgi:hypothetical protein